MIFRAMMISFITMINIILGNIIAVNIIIGNIIITIINIVNNIIIGLNRGFLVRNLCRGVDVVDMLLVWLLILLCTLLPNKIQDFLLGCFFYGWLWLMPVTSP